jgi:ubiquinone/menaquinone biosynthesis C-methylase UbiE
METTTNATAYSAAATFDSVGPAYESAFASCEPQVTSIQWLIAQLPAKGCKILDIGCGTGRPVCSMLADAGHDVLGIDVSGGMLAAARSHVKNAQFEQVDYRAFQGEYGSFEAITVYFSLIAGVTQDEIRNAFKKIHSWLKPGGYFIFSTVPIDGNNLEIKWMGRPVVVSSLTAEEGVAAIRAAGFEILDEKQSTFMPQAVEAGICLSEEIWEETHLFVYAKKAS